MAAGKDPLDEAGGEGTAAEESRSFVTDAVKKAVLAGMGALFLTEEGARKLAREWKLPKDLAGYLGGQAAGAKAELQRIVAEDIRRFLESDAVRREFLRHLTSTAIEVKAEIRFRDLGGEVKPEVQAHVHPRTRGEAKGEG